jgi:nucleotide-binding universal stress UspA family protein
MFASKLAKEVGARLHIFHAVDISLSDSMTIKNQEEIESKIATAQEKIYAQYLSKLKDFNNYDVAIWEGTPYVEILKFARDKSADLIVMAHHTREIDPEKALLGSTVEQVVLRSACPVASVNHPDKVALAS